MSDNEVKIEQGQDAQTEMTGGAAVSTNQSDETVNKVARYKNTLRMSMIFSAVAFIAWFIFRDNIIISLFAMILCALPLRDASGMLKDKEMMQRSGVQRGNVVGVLVLSIVSAVLWVGLFVYQFLHLTD